MARLLTIPNFSTPILPENLDLGPSLTLHYAKADVDHGRAVVAFSGEAREVCDGLLSLASKLLPTIDLRHLPGAHPRVGALDVAPFVDLDGDEARGVAERFGAIFARHFEVPVTMYERNARAGRPERLPELRRPEMPTVDYGPRTPHPVWGRTVVGARNALIAANLVFPLELRETVRRAARALRAGREAGESILEGVRALTFDLPSRNLVQLSFNLTCPDTTGFDAVAERAEALVGSRAFETELIGVIRREDLPRSTRFQPTPEQIIGGHEDGPPS